MTDKDPDVGIMEKDRKLGDEWLDWNGSTTPQDGEIDEKASTFLALAAGATLILVACLWLAWYLAKPRIDQLSPVISGLVEWSACLLAVLLLILIALETTLLLKFSKSTIPYLCAERLLLFLLAGSVRLGQKLAVNRDRVDNSFIKVHNLLVKRHARELSLDPVLILFPRCMEREARLQVAERVNGKAVQIVTVGGGEGARKAVGQYAPSLIIAVACERDLISGIRDVPEKAYVLAIPNRRAEGPCKNTRVSLEALDDALRFVGEKTGKAAKPSERTHGGLP